MKKYGMLAAACGLFAAAAAPLPAAAQDSILKLDSVFAGIGAYDPLAKDDQAVALRVDARFAKKLAFDRIQPWVGLDVNTDGSVWAGGGIFADFYVTPKFVITPSTGIGLHAKGSGKDLGGPVQFRTSLEAAFKINPEGDTIGIFGQHTSNAGLYNKNPGTEAFGFFFRKAF